MTQLTDYQAFVNSTARVKDKFWYACLGLAGETGEVIEHIKKVVRDENSTVSDERKQAIKLELGDVFWYATRLANELGLTLEEILNSNIEKLTHRQKHGKVTG